VRVFLIGANGQLGTDLQRVFRSQGTTVIPATHGDLDVRNAEGVFSAIAEVRADVVISTAAYHKVEECENQASLAFDVNALGPRNLAQACDRAGSVLVHFSTDYVFDGRQRIPYSEADPAHPLSVYGVSKLAGEHFVAAVFERYFVVRTCGLYGLAGSSGKGGNFVETLLKKAAAGTPIRVVDDQVLTPTYTADLAEAVAKMCELDQYGVYHISNEGECSWYEFARTIFELEKLQVDLTPVSSREFPSPVRRPSYSVLSKKKLYGIGLTMPLWQEGLARYLAARRAKATPSVQSVT
jgi:dTDP-4-dehydrorhamnose reductase